MAWFSMSLQEVKFFRNHDFLLSESTTIDKFRRIVRIVGTPFLLFPGVREASLLTQAQELFQAPFQGLLLIWCDWSHQINHSKLSELIAHRRSWDWDTFNHRGNTLLSDWRRSCQHPSKPTSNRLVLALSAPKRLAGRRERVWKKMGKPVELILLKRICCVLFESWGITDSFCDQRDRGD